MGIEGIGHGKIVPIDQLRDSRAARELAEDRRKAAKAQGRSEVSDRQRLLMEAKEELKDLPDVRRDKVIEAKLRISSGYYNGEAVRREVLRSLLASLLPPRPQQPPPAGEGEAEDPKG